MLVLKIDVTKIDKAHIYAGQKGKYLELVVIENRDGPDKFGNSHMVVQGISKEARAKGERGVILGNGKEPQMPTQRAVPAPRSHVHDLEREENDLPY